MAAKDHESPQQIDKFRKLARELECDDDEAAFKAKVAKVLQAPRPSRDDEASK